jgi:hypothetical protein
VIINIYYSIPLLKELIPSELNEEEKIIYKKHFKKFLKRVEFKCLLECHRRRVYKVASTLVNKGNVFSSVFFLAKIPHEVHCQIILKMGRTKISNLTEYSWIGNFHD